MTHSLRASGASAGRCSGDEHYKSPFPESLGAAVTGLGNNDFGKTFFNEGSSFLLICSIPPVITHTQELLSAFIARFDLRVPGFYQSDHQRQRKQECQDHWGFDGIVQRALGSCTVHCYNLKESLPKCHVSMKNFRSGIQLFCLRGTFQAVS